MARRKPKKPPKPNAEYELHAPSVKAKYRVLALDPGSRNMGISVVGIHNKKVKVIANSLMTNPMTSLVNGLNTSLNVYLAEIDRWITKYEPECIILERFQSRGGMGPLIELVSGMVMAVCTEYRDRPCKVITAATWKNQFHRTFKDYELNDVYPECLTTPHQLDATLIGIYGLQLVTRTEWEYEPWDIVAQVEATSCLPLRTKRKSK